VLRSPTPICPSHAGQAAAEIAGALPGVRVLTGQPGQTLTQLRQLAREVLGLAEAEAVGERRELV
jgi:hypothetical protein